MNKVSFHIETTDMDLGDTPIENIFINDFMPMADGTAVKVYLLGYKYANDKDETISVSNDTISKHLTIPLIDVLRAWDFWEEKGIIKKHSKETDDEYDYNVEFFNLKQLLIKNNYLKSKQPSNNTSFNNKYVCSPEELSNAKQNPVINNMFNEIRKLLGRYITPNEYKRVYEWMTNYNMGADMILRAFQYSVQNKNKRSMSYIEGIIRNWYDNDITNLKTLEEYYKNKDERYYNYERIMKAMGFKGRYLTEGEMKVIDRWFYEWNFNMDMVLKACDNTKNISNPNLNYIDKILQSWFNKGIKTTGDIEQKDTNKNAGPSNVSRKNTHSKKYDSNKVNTKFHNFEQRTSKYTAEELENIVRKKNR